MAEYDVPKVEVSQELISIDDNEQANLKKACDEIFGEENFRGSITRATGTTTGQDALKIGSSYDSCLCYSKSIKFQLKGIPLKGKDLNRFSNDDNDGKGKYALLQLRKTGNADRKEDREAMFFPIKGPDGNDVFPIGPTDYLSRWRTGKVKFQSYLNEGLIVWKENGEDIEEIEDEDDENDDVETDYLSITNDNVDISKYKSKWKPYVKYYLSERTKQVSNLWTDVDGNKKGSIELKELFDKKKLFENPKPTDFIKRLITISASSSDLILDFFSGSATTAHAVMALNAKDSGIRKFIMVQLPEKTDENSGAFKAGYKTISQIGMERIRRAGDKIIAELKEEQKDQESLLEDDTKIIDPNALDIGFKVFKLDTTNLSIWDEKTEDLEQTLLENVDAIKDGRTEVDVLYEVLIKYGIDLTVPIEEEKVGGKKIYLIAGGYLTICLEDGLDLAFIEELAKRKPQRVVFRDTGFKDDAVKTNAEMTLKKHGVEDIKVL